MAQTTVTTGWAWVPIRMKNKAAVGSGGRQAQARTAATMTGKTTIGNSEMTVHHPRLPAPTTAVVVHMLHAEVATVGGAGVTGGAGDDDDQNHLHTGECIHQ